MSLENAPDDVKLAVDLIVLLEENDVYDEMKPFVATIKQQHVDILKHSQMRQEFTANVSHELKTPLQGIIGSADLIETGMVKPEDMPRFIGHIRKEATRLVALIEDIIRLSQLDEGNELPCEEFDLMDIAEEVEQNLEQVQEISPFLFRVETRLCMVFADLCMRLYIIFVIMPLSIICREERLRLWSTGREKKRFFV